MRDEVPRVKKSKNAARIATADNYTVRKAERGGAHDKFCG